MFASPPDDQLSDRRSSKAHTVILQYDIDAHLPEIVAQVLDCDPLRRLQGAAIWSDWENRFLITKERPVEVQIFSDDRAPKADWHDQIWPGQMAPILRLEHGGLKVQAVQWGRYDRQTGVWSTEVAAERLSIARPCLLPVSTIYQECERGDDFVSKIVCYCAPGAMMGGMVLPPTQSEPEAFVILTGPTGDLASHLARQPLVIPREERADWMDIQKDSRRLQRVAPLRILSMLEVRDR